ncbi:MAG: RsmD family RNA methyltransferase [Proteobacteria bacterium]|nr:RsmD family RNA methyltransferase [Pseudomonadota bacterium]
MSIRLTGGTARSRVLREKVVDGVRPTSARVREAFFAIVGHNLEGVRFLDAFGGAGLMGLEAWSRGAEVTVVEKRRVAVASIRRRGAEVDADWTVLQGDVLRVQLEPFDGVFVDPPYAMGADPLEVLAPLAKHWLVLEASADIVIPPAAGKLSLDRVRRYGGSQLAIYRAS